MRTIKELQDQLKEKEVNEVITELLPLVEHRLPAAIKAANVQTRRRESVTISAEDLGFLANLAVKQLTEWSKEIKQEDLSLDNYLSMYLENQIVENMHVFKHFTSAVRYGTGEAELQIFESGDPIAKYAVEKERKRKQAKSNPSKHILPGLAPVNSEDKFRLSLAGKR